MSFWGPAGVMGQANVASEGSMAAHRRGCSPQSATNFSIDASWR